jgi:hypothetical protein
MKRSKKKEKLTEKKTNLGKQKKQIPNCRVKKREENWVINILKSLDKEYNEK